MTTCFLKGNEWVRMRQKGVSPVHGEELIHIIHDASTAPADTPLRRAWQRVASGQASRLALPGLDILFQVCLAPSAFRVPVSRGVSTVSSRTVMNNAG